GSLCRVEPHDARRDLLDVTGATEERVLVRTPRQRDECYRRELAQPLQNRLDVAALVEHVCGEREVESILPGLAPVPQFGPYCKPVARGVLAKELDSVGRPVGGGHRCALRGRDQRG